MITTQDREEEKDNGVKRGNRKTHVTRDEMRGFDRVVDKLDTEIDERL